MDEKITAFELIGFILGGCLFIAIAFGFFGVIEVVVNTIFL